MTQQELIAILWSKRDTDCKWCHKGDTPHVCACSYDELCRLARLGARIEAMQPGECLYREGVTALNEDEDHLWKFGELYGYDFDIDPKKSGESRHESPTAAIEAYDKEKPCAF